MLQKEEALRMLVLRCHQVVDTKIDYESFFFAGRLVQVVKRWMYPWCVFFAFFFFLLFLGTTESTIATRVEPIVFHLFYDCCNGINLPSHLLFFTLGLVLFKIDKCFMIVFVATATTYMVFSLFLLFSLESFWEYDLVSTSQSTYVTSLSLPPKTIQ